MNTEIWKPVEGFEKYEVSNLGRVRSKARRGQTEWHIMSPVRRSRNDERLYVMLRRDGKSHAHFVAHLVARAFIPTTGTNMRVKFKDGDRTNNAVQNLEWVTLSEVNRKSRMVNGTNFKLKPCLKDGCKKTASSKGLCKSHYYAQHRQRVFGTGTARFYKDVVTYEGAHERVRRVKGLVHTHKCDCGEPATQWSLSVDTAKPYVQKNGRSAGLLYSLDVEDYRAMCVRCHCAYDAKHRSDFKALAKEATRHEVTENPTAETKALHANIVKRVKETGSLSLVAEEVGYDISYVSRAFANAEGIGFREWMKGAAA